jgi:hypothetical protein
MTDTFHIIDNNLSNQTFYYNGSNTWQIWQKPPNCNYVNIFLLGGGAGGQGGEIGTGGAGGVTRDGGVGGGSSSITYVTYPAFALPDTLYVQVGAGGAGGAAAIGTGLQGSPGGLSYISVIPDSGYTTQNVVMVSGNAPAGTTTCNTAGTGIIVSQILLSEIAFISTYNGQAGAARGLSSGTAGSITPTGIPITGGAGGSGVNSVGTLGTSGDINEFLFSPKISGGASNQTLGGSPGRAGYSTRSSFYNANYKLPLFFTGGSGGGAGDTSPGANGGNGAFGCGGGGGGAGQTSAGTGGRGGDGLVIITVS